jgi:Kef-type K+ transport systems, membrane components
MDHLIFQIGLAIVLMAIATIVANRLKLSVVPLLILVGFAVGPHAPSFGIIDLRFIQSQALIEFMGRLGILFVLFYLGLEFSASRLFSSGRSIIITLAITVTINLTIGILFGRSLDYSIREVLVVGGIFLCSSTTIVAKIILDLKRTARPETSLILGVTMGEDIVLVLYLAMVSGIVLFGTTSLVSAATSLATALIFVILMLTLGRRFAQRQFLTKWLGRLSQEAFLLVIFASLFLVAGLAGSIGLAEALGALLIGLVVAETGHAQRMQDLAFPFRDFFGAFLFFSFGLSIDPLTLGGAAGLAVIAALFTIVGNLMAGTIAGWATKLPAIAGVSLGLTIVSRAEYSIVMATVARNAGLAPFIQPFAALYVLILSIAGPLLTKESDRIYFLGDKVKTSIFKFGKTRSESITSKDKKEFSKQSKPDDKK